MAELARWFAASRLAVEFISVLIAGTRYADAVTVQRRTGWCLWSQRTCWITADCRIIRRFALASSQSRGVTSLASDDNHGLAAASGLDASAGEHVATDDPAVGPGLLVPSTICGTLDLRQRSAGQSPERTRRRRGIWTAWS